MKKLLASDLDGTLVFEEKIPNENRQSVEKLNKSGQVFVVATGRPLNGVEALEKDFNINIDYYVLLNGALILDKNKNSVMHKTIKKETIKEILEKYTDNEMKVSVESGYITYVLGEGGNLPYPEQTFIENIDEVDENLSLISMYIEGRSIKEIEVIKDSINKNYKEVIAYRNSNYIDVVPLGCSKGNGVLHVAKELEIKEENVFTIGDSWNDVTMFNVTKNSFTFYEVEEELKENANYLVNSVSECIENYVLV